MLFLPALGTRPYNSLTSFLVLFPSTLLCDSARALSLQNSGSTSSPALFQGMYCLGFQSSPPSECPPLRPVSSATKTQFWRQLGAGARIHSLLHSRWGSPRPSVP